MDEVQAEGARGLSEPAGVAILTTLKCYEGTKVDGTEGTCDAHLANAEGFR